MLLTKKGVRVMTDMEIRQLFEKAVEEYSDMITGLCLLRLGNRHDAEDCYQNVFLKLFKNTEMLKEDPEHLKAWLIRVAINECKNRFRFLSRNKTEALDFVNLYYEDTQDRRLMECIMSLSKIYKDVIYLHYYAGYSVSELAKILKSRENTIKSRLRRGREMLKEMFDDSDYTEG